MPPTPEVSPVAPSTSAAHRLIISVLIAVLVIAAGASAYYHYQPFATVPPATASSTAASEQTGFKLLYMDTSNSNRVTSGYTIRIAAYDPRTTSKQDIATYEDSQLNGFGTITSTDGMTGREFYYGLGTGSGASLITSNTGGTATTSIPLVQGYLANVQQEAFMPGGQKVAWCGTGGISVHDYGSGKTQTVASAYACSLGADDLAFSRDGSKLYYDKGFYELGGDYTDAELAQMNQEGHNGLHLIDLASGTDTLLIPAGTTINQRDAVLWNDPLVNLAGKVLLIKTYAGDTDTVTVKQLADTSFDYLTSAQIAALPTIATLELPHRALQEVILSADGQGIFYEASPEGKPSFTGSDLGYFDIGSQSNTFPLPNVGAEQDPSPVAALTKDALVYRESKDLGLSGGAEHYESELYVTTSTGQNKLLDSTAGYFGIIGVVAQ